jgi:nickel-dependent lactate racemase
LHWIFLFLSTPEISKHTFSRKGAEVFVDLPYGKQMVQVQLPDHTKVAYSQNIPGVPDIRSEIRHALNHPTGCMPLRKLALGKSDVVIVINDITRPAPTSVMLEELFADLKSAGIRDDAITILIASGNHRPSTPEEIAFLAGPILHSRARIINHNCEDQAQLSFVGQTDTGLPIWVNSELLKASLKILTGIITPHHTAGYSGGRKSVIPGVAGLTTLQKHHSFPIRPYQPTLGRIHDNTFHDEAVKGARMVGVDFILNVVKNDQGQVTKALAGDLVAAHEQGVSQCEESWLVKLPHRYDIVVVTPGGHPMDIDLHQAQKAMSVAETIIEADGIIVLIAKCPEGIGKFANWLKSAKTPREVIDRFTQEGFTHQQSSKAFMCARALDRYTVIVSCSGIARKELEEMFFRFAPSPQAAIDEALKLKGPASSTLVLPYAVNCIPKVAHPRVHS